MPIKEFIPRLTPNGQFTRLGPDGNYIHPAVTRHAAETSGGHIPVARVFLFQNTPDIGRRVFVQQRGYGKSLWPGRFDASIVETGQLQPDNIWEPESPEQTARRGLKEELGITVVDFTGSYQDRYNGDTMTSHITTYTAEYYGEFTQNRAEVADAGWSEVAGMRRYIERDSEMFTPSFVQFVTKHPELFV